MQGTHGLVPDITTTQDLSAAVLDFTTSVGRPFKLDSIEINFNDGADPPVAVAVTQTITITRKSAKGAIYDTIIARVSVIAESNYIHIPRNRLTFQAGDEINVYCTDAAGVGIANVTIKASELIK